jgi:hypothetical protein
MPYPELAHVFALFHYNFINFPCDFKGYECNIGPKHQAEAQCAGPS